MYVTPIVFEEMYSSHFCKDKGRDGHEILLTPAVIIVGEKQMLILDNTKD